MNRSFPLRSAWSETQLPAAEAKPRSTVRTDLTESLREAQRQLLLAGKHYVMASTALLQGVVGAVESRVDQLDRVSAAAADDNWVGGDGGRPAATYAPSVPHLTAEFREAPEEHSGTESDLLSTPTRTSKAVAKRSKAAAKSSASRR